MSLNTSGTASSDPSRASSADRLRSSPLELLGQREFRRIWLVGGFSGTMRWLEVLAVSVYVFDLTSSPLLVAVLTFLRMAPMLFFGALFGAVADRVNRKALLATGLMVMSVVSTLLALLALWHRLEVWQLAVGAFLSGVYFAIDFPIRRTMLGEVAGSAQIGVAMGLDSATSNATRAAGPTIGGVLLQLIGIQGAFFLGTALYGTAAILIATVHYRQTIETAGVKLLANLRAGFAYVRSRELIVATLVVTVLVNLWGFPYQSMVPVIGQERLGLDPFAVGLLMSADGLGALVGSLLIASRGVDRSFTRLYIAGSLLFLTMILVFALSRWYGLSLPILFLAGLGVAGFATMQSTIILLVTPPALRTRVMGVLAVSIGFGPLGILHVGLMADYLGASTAVVIMTLEGLVALVIAIALFPSLRRNGGVEPDAAR